MTQGSFGPGSRGMFRRKNLRSLVDSYTDNTFVELRLMGTSKAKIRSG